MLELELAMEATVIPVPSAFGFGGPSFARVAGT